MTALHHAIESAKTEAALLLIKHGADVNALDVCPFACGPGRLALILVC
jgi:ankyrin repeat protein